MCSRCLVWSTIYFCKGLSVDAVYMKVRRYHGCNPACLGGKAWSHSHYSSVPGRNVIHWAVSVGSDQVLQVLLEWVLVLCKRSRAPRPQAAPSPKDNDVMRTILFQKMTTSSGDTPLHIATRIGVGMKVYTLMKLEPWAMMVKNSEGLTSLDVGVQHLEGCSSKVKTSEVRFDAIQFDNNTRLFSSSLVWRTVCLLPGAGATAWHFPIPLPHPDEIWLQIQWRASSIPLSHWLLVLESFL